MSYLETFSAFDVLTAADVAILERVFVVESKRAGHVFIREGDRATAVTAAMYLILEGTVEVVARAPEGGFGVHRSMDPGQMFGIVAFLQDVTRTATVRASSAVKVARLDRRTFEGLYTKDAGVHARFQIVVARQLARDIRNTGELLARAIHSGDVEPIAAHFG